MALTPEAEKVKQDRLRDALVKIFSGLLVLVFVVFMFLFWFK